MFICVKSVMQMWLLCVLAALAPREDKPSLREVQTQAQVQSWETELCVGGLAFGWLPGSPANPQPEPGFQQLPVRFAFRGEICQLQTQRRCMMQISEIKSKNNDNYSETLWEIFKSTYILNFRSLCGTSLSPLAVAVSLLIFWLASSSTISIGLLSFIPTSSPVKL